MEDDDPVTDLAPVATVAGLSVVDPTGGAAVSVLNHLLTAATSDAGWRKANEGMWTDILIENDEERRDQHRAVVDDLTRHRLIIEWLQHELSLLHGRVEDLESVALGMLQQSEALLRIRFEPEMRPYLRAAWSNALHKPARFPATWVRRLTDLLSKIGAEHIRLIKAIASKKKAADKSTAKMAGGEFSAILDSVGPDGDGLILFEELRGLQVLERAPAGGDFGIIVRPIAARLVEFITDPSAPPEKLVV